MFSIKCSIGLPFNYELFLIQKYNSFITTCKYIEINYPSHDFNYMLVYEEETLVDLLIFGNLGKNSRCFNALTIIDSNILIDCIHKLFELYPQVKKILIDASYNKHRIKNSFLINKSEDYVLFLPDNIEKYNSELGSKTRKHLKKRIERLKREFADVSFNLKYGVEIEEYQTDKIIQFNYERMQSIGKVSGIDHQSKTRLFKYSQSYGCLATLEIDGEIVAGCIATILNNQIFLHVLAFNSAHSNYNVGEICAYKLLETTINKKISKVHFLWGKSELKRRFLAKSIEIYSYNVYKHKSLLYYIASFKSYLLFKILKFKDYKLLKPLKKIVTNFKIK